MRTSRSLTASSGRGACVAGRGMRGKEGHAWRGGVVGGVHAWQGVYMVGAVRGGEGACPPVNKMTDACKNITLPQTSFAGGKNLRIRNKLPHFNSQHARRLCLIPLSFAQCLWK